MLLTTSASDLALDLVLLILVFGYVISLIKKGLPILFIFYMRGYCLSFIVLVFSSFYWAHRGGFSQPLTRLEAAYVALGTLAGGTGNILATKDGAREIQMTQEFVDLVFLLLVVGVALVPIAVIASSKQQARARTKNAAGPGTASAGGDGGNGPVT